MGQRQEPRIQKNLPASLCGIDVQGRTFFDPVTIENISARGVLIHASQSRANIGDVVVLRCGQNRGRFRVTRAVERPNAPGRSLGLVHLLPTPLSWDVSLPLPAPDTYLRPRLQTRRCSRRFPLEMAVEFRADKSSTVWSSTRDIGQDGCFVHMLNVLPLSTTIDIAMWVGETKVWAKAKVVSCLSGSGIGLKFLEISGEGSQRLREVIQECPEVKDRRLAADKDSDRGANIVEVHRQPVSFDASFLASAT